MNSLYKEPGERYFCAANTKDGFVSYFDKVFNETECDRVYILKGGPGVGKSTFMKRLALLSRENGCSVEYFHCSSDPESLDGIIIKEKRTAVVDGTSPHTLEPKTAGVREIIIDLGRAWDTDLLFKHREEIFALSEGKKKQYDDCYTFLYSKSVMDGLVYNLVFPYILFDKLDKSAARFSKNLLKGFDKKKESKVRTRLISAFSTLGKIRLSTYENSAEMCVFLKEPFDSCGLSSIFLGRVYEYALQAGADIDISFCSENKDKICALYLPEIKVSISGYDENSVMNCDKILKKCRIINCARFLDLKKLSPLKPLRKFYSKLSENMEKQALECLREAGKAHMDLEKIYRLCTNYKTVEKISNEYFKKIL